MCQQLTGTKVSPYLKEKLVYLGQLECYEKASELSKLLLKVDVSDSTIYRLTDGVGEQVVSIIDSPQTREEIKLKPEEVMYVQCDGSLLLTREEKWKEVKLGRVFKSSSILPDSTNRQWIRESEYIAHLGAHEGFENLMSQLIDDPYRLNEERVVFIGDGARWQWSWVEAEYPKAIQILDFYHVMEHIGDYISKLFVKKEQVNTLTCKIGNILKTKGIGTVMRYLEKIPRNSKQKEEAYHNLLIYVKNNKTRMDYPKYIKNNLLIGSGAIESAHRTVLQKRLKLSGQRWSKKGMTNMIKLRSAMMSGYWNIIQGIIRKAA